MARLAMIRFPAATAATSCRAASARTRSTAATARTASTAMPGGGAGADHFDFGTIFTEGAIGKDAITDFQIGVDVILRTGWNLAFGVTLTLESRTNGCALVTAMGDAIFLRGVTTAAFSLDDVLH